MGDHATIRSEANSFKNESPFIIAEIKKSPQLFFIFTKINNTEELFESEAKTLLNTPLPLLQFFAEMVIKNYKVPSRTRIKNLLYIPIAQLIESKGVEYAWNQISEIIKANLRFQKKHIRIVIDRWHGDFQNKKLFDCISKIIKEYKKFVIFLGPSTFEIKTALKSRFIQNNISTQVFLQHLCLSGCHSIEGGSDNYILSTASSLNFRINVTQLVSSYDHFIKNIFSLKNIGSIETYCPIPESKRYDYLRLLLLSRILMPKTPYIRGHKSLLRSEIINALPLFGVNDFGYFAINEETKKHLGLANPNTPVANYLYERINVS